MKKIMFGLLLLVVCGNVSSVRAVTTMQYCPTLVGSGTVCRGATSSSVTDSATVLQPARAGGILGCLRATKYNVINNSTGATVFNAYWSTCTDCDVDNGFERKYVSDLPMIKTPAVDVTSEGTPYTNEVTYTGYVCCGPVTGTTSEDIFSPNGYYGYVGKRNKTVTKAAYTLTTGVCTAVTPSTKYNCSCVDGFVSNKAADSTSSCSCILDTAGGYVCHATGCSGWSTTQGVYISDDGSSCALCPTYTDALGTLRYGKTLGTAPSVRGCYSPEGIVQEDDTGIYTHSENCYYNE